MLTQHMRSNAPGAAHVVVVGERGSGHRLTDATHADCRDRVTLPVTLQLRGCRVRCGIGRLGHPKQALLERDDQRSGRCKKVSGSVGTSGGMDARAQNADTEKGVVPDATILGSERMQETRRSSEVQFFSQLSMKKPSDGAAESCWSVAAG